MTNPTFGEKKEGVTYKTRYGVYAVIPDSTHEKIILVQAPMVHGSCLVARLKQVKIILKL